MANDYTLHGNGLYLPRDYEPEPPRQQFQLEFFAYETVGVAIIGQTLQPAAAVTADAPFVDLPPGDYETHVIMAYLDQYEARLMDHVEDLLMRFPHIDAFFDYQSELTWKKEIAERRIDYYDKLGL